MNKLARAILEFIQAIQLACIKYLEIKCQQLNIADNIE